MLPFELLESKLRPPRIGGLSVPRAALIDRLSGADRPPIVVVRAGPGYGKTTLLAQWAGSHDQPAFAWVSVDRHDNDPVVLLTYVAAALDRVSPIDPGVFDALASPGATIETRVMPRLGAALASLAKPVVLVLDDVHTIDSPECIDALVALGDHLAEGSRLALSARDLTALPLGLLRTRALTLELGPDDLRMEREEARALLTASGVEVSDEDLAKLMRRTEGWPAGLYLAALSASGAAVGAGAAAAITGNDPLVVDFLESEFLRQLPRDQHEFLLRTSMFEELTGSLCDAALASSGSADLLDALERSNGFVVALDRDRGWYRCHPLVRDVLAATLARQGPDVVQTLLTRASDWCAANGRPTAAVAYAQIAADTDRVAALMERWLQPAFQSGRTATVTDWLDWLEEHAAPRSYPSVAAIATMLLAVMGRPAASDRWAEALEHAAAEGPLSEGSSSMDSWRALIRAFRCRSGVAAMRTDAALAASTLAPGSTWRPTAEMLHGAAALLSGSPDEADDHFANAAEEAHDLGAPGMVPIALAERALVAIGRDEWARADELAERAVRAARHSPRDEAAVNAFVYAVAARTAIHAGRTSDASELLTSAQRRLPGLTHAVPIPAAQTRLELAWAYLALADQAGARNMLREVQAMLRRRPDLGTLTDQAAELESRLSSALREGPGISALTTAELRLLPLLTTHLTFKEIGAREHLSRHTVKSHAMSTYRKLGVTSRNAAVERAREVGLL